MSTLIVAAIIIGTIIAICYLLITIANKQKNKRMNTIMKQFSRLGTNYNLSFSSHEFLGNVIIGLDGINRKLLILEIDSMLRNKVIDLNEVKHCTVKKYYGSIKPGGLKSNKIESFLEKVCLNFELHKGMESNEIVFYNHIDNHAYQLSVLEQKATHWKEVLTKMLKADTSVTRESSIVNHRH